MEKVEDRGIQIKNLRSVREDQGVDFVAQFRGEGQEREGRLFLPLGRVFIFVFQGVG